MHIVERIPHTFSLNHKIFLLFGKSICYHYNVINNHIKEYEMTYVCQVCGYVYDPAENDGIPFEQLPEDWVCPTCGVGKSDFAAA